MDLIALADALLPQDDRHSPACSEPVVRTTRAAQPWRGRQGTLRAALRARPRLDFAGWQRLDRYAARRGRKARSASARILGADQVGRASMRGSVPKRPARLDNSSSR
jgi:hypothetical protein